jgi:hypothetical protein
MILKVGGSRYLTGGIGAQISPLVKKSKNIKIYSVPCFIVQK